MSRTRDRLWSMAPLGVVLALLGWVEHSLALPGVLAFVLAAVSFAPPKLEVDKATQRVVGIVVFILGVSIVRASLSPDPDRRLHVFWIGILTSSVALVSFRALCKNPDGGPRATFAIELVALLAVGETRIGWAYAAAVFAFLALSLYSLRTSDTARPDIRDVSPYARRVGALLTGLTGVVLVTMAAPARPLANVVHRKIEAVFDKAYENRVGTWSDGMRLGKLSKMLRSNTVAARVYGPNPELLRAVVFDHYQDGIFTVSRPKEVVSTEARLGPLTGEDVTFVLRGSRDVDRFLLPLGAHDVTTTTGQVQEEPLGILRGSSPAATKRYWYRWPHPGSEGASPPTAEDLAIPDAVRPSLEALASSWTEGLTQPQEIVERLSQHLRSDFRYELDHDHSLADDPVLHFLFRDRAGHCEYFAASLTLLSRAKGIPARYVSGYRVSERNPIDGHFVVRERNAHSWSEVYLASPEGRAPTWASVDPTPFREQAGATTGDESTSTATFDLLASYWERAEAWLADRTLLELALAATGATVIFALVRYVGRKREARANARQEALAFSETPTFFHELLLAFERKGVVKTGAMSLERFAQTLDDERARGLVLRYVVHRYGDAEDASLEADVVRYTRSLKSA